MPPSPQPWTPRASTDHAAHLSLCQARCFLTKAPLKLGHACSVCLAVFHHDVLAACPICGTRFMRQLLPPPGGAKKKQKKGGAAAGGSGGGAPAVTPLANIRVDASAATRLGPPSPQPFPSPSSRPSLQVDDAEPANLAPWQKAPAPAL